MEGEREETVFGHRVVFHLFLGGVDTLSWRGRTVTLAER